MPAALVERPTLPEYLQGVWLAFNDLSDDRPLAPGIIGAIPFTAVDRYAVRYGIDDRDEFEVFHGRIRAMDRVWRSVMAERIKRAQPR